jgi:hypothetical protein
MQQSYYIAGSKPLIKSLKNHLKITPRQLPAQAARAKVGAVERSSYPGSGPPAGLKSRIRFEDQI